MSPASVPSLAENVESTPVDMIGLSPSWHSAANADAPLRLRLKAEALMRISLRIKDMERGFVPRHRQCPKNDTLERR
jgi:hypothetical protein